MRYNRVFKQILWFIVAGFIGIIFWIGFVPKMSLSQQPDARLNSLESDFRNLEARLNRLESQIGRTSGITPRKPAPDNRRSDRNTITQTQSFDNLATLAIETKQQVNQLEARVKKLEARKQ